MIFNKQKSATLASRITALDGETAAGATALADLHTRRRDAIRDGDDAAATKLEELIATAERKATLQAERREILAAEHEKALEADAREEFSRRHAAQKEANEKTAIAAQKALRRAWDILAPALRELDEARAATDLLNKAAPDGFASLAYADDIARSTPANPREEISSKIVQQWCFRSTGDRVSDQSTVRGGVLSNGRHAPAQQCVERSFRHVRYHPAQTASFAAPISTELRFPRWDSAGAAFDGAFIMPGSVPAALDIIKANQSGETARPILEEFIVVEDVASDAA